jgi:hypothetical protein
MRASLRSTSFLTLRARTQGSVLSCIRSSGLRLPWWHLPDIDGTPKSRGTLNNLSSIMFDRLTKCDSPDVQALKFRARSRLRSSRKLEIAKGCNKVFNFAVRRGFARFEIALNA